MRMKLIGLTLSILMACSSNVLATIGGISGHPEDAIEALTLEFIGNNGSVLESVTAEGCGNCPKSFDLSSMTQFFLEGTQISSKQAIQLTGKPGTVIFNVDSKIVTKIIW